MSEAWKGTDARSLRPRELKWLRRKLVSTFEGSQFAIKHANGQGMPLAEFPNILELAIDGWYMKYPERYVTLEHPNTITRGARAKLTVSYDGAQVLMDWWLAYGEAARLRDQTTYKTIDQWLKALAGNEFLASGDRGGIYRVPRKMRQRVERAAKDRRRNRTCRCGEVYLAQRDDQVNCPTCIAKRKNRAQPTDGSQRRREKR